MIITYRERSFPMVKKCLILFGLLLFASTSFAINITTQQSSRRIFLLEAALAPANPEAVANAWANAAKNRNGAVQYMLMCPDLQKANLSNLEALNWVTGVSSPWISSTKIISEKTKEDSSNFAVQYEFSLSNGVVGSVVDHIHVILIDRGANLSQKFCISQFGYLSPVSKL